MKIYVYKRDMSISSRQYAADALRRYTGDSAKEFAFYKGKHGKPYLEGNELFFSVSHSGDILICAVSRQEVGADVEKIRAVKNCLKIAKRCFPDENVSNESSFFKAWVKEEAYLKYKGTGFSEGERTSDRESVSIKAFNAEDGYDFAVCTKEEESIEIVKLFS